MDPNPNSPRASSPKRPADKLDARALARARRDAMLRRARRIRRSVAAIAATLFAAAFLAIYVQLASGNDPALSSASTAASTIVASNTTSSSSTAAAKKTAAKRAAEKLAAEERAAETSSSGSGETSQSATPVTTSQS